MDVRRRKILGGKVHRGEKQLKKQLNGSVVHVGEPGLSIDITAC